MNHKCLPEDILAIEDYTEEQSAFIKEHKLKKVAPLGSGKRYMRLYECPITYITQDTRDIIQLLYTIENTNQLLHEGGLSKQPAWLIEALQIFKTELYYSREKNGKQNT